jgi:hypothetical protein
MKCPNCGSDMSTGGRCPCSQYRPDGAAGAGRPKMTDQVEAPVPYREGSGGGGREMLVGAIWCIGGIVVTVMSYNAAASSPGGGRYVVAYGAIIYGALQFFRGMAR